MLKTGQPLSQTASASKRVERLAWMIMLTGFGIFCGLAFIGGNYLYYWVTRVPEGEIRAEVYQQAVTLQKSGLATREILQDDPLNPGDIVRVNEQALPGSATTLRFGTTAMSLWAGTELQIRQFGPQWNDTSAATARFSLTKGQLLVDIAGNDQRIEIETPYSSEPILLQSPGQYRVRILTSDDPATPFNDSPTTAIAERSPLPTLEVTTAQGLALLGDREIKPGERILATRPSEDRLAATWPLLRDGSFQELVLQSLQQQAPTVWRIQREASVADAAKSGQVIPAQDCLNPMVRDDCEEPYVRLVRKGGNTKGFSTALAQNIDADVASYEHVWLRADIKIVDQSLSRAGELGTECPMLIRVRYSNADGDDAQRDFCYWAKENGDQGALSNLPYIKNTRLALGQWYSEAIDLKQDIPNLVKIHNISFEANGHDYESHVKHAELTAEGLATIPTP